MNRVLHTLSFVARFAILGLALAFVVGLMWPDTGAALRQRFGVEPASPAGAATTATVAASTSTALPAVMATGRQVGPVSYADAVAHAAPAVVNIYANKIVTEQPTYNDPLLQRVFGSVPSGPAFQRREQSLGSGVIVNAQLGYVLTNNHVIAGAEKIQVLLYDGRVAEAKVVGADNDSDLAVLKIDAGNLPDIHIATTPPRVGDVVLAIGNPLGIGQTVTMGIVSAIQRQLNAASPEEFIQTDAAINFGNSGGALVNARGELVGINTALLGRASGAEGISFAIPVSTAKMVLDQIVDHGHVVRGWLGADYGNLPIAANSGLPAAANGAMVTDVYPGSPAARAGIKVGDVLLRLDNKNITDPTDLRHREAALKPGTHVDLSGLRAGVPFHVELVLAQRPSLATLIQMNG